MEEQKLLSQDETVQEYLRVLFDSHMEQDSRGTMTMCSSLDILETQFNELMNEIKELKENVQQLQNPEVKSRIKVVLDKTEQSFKYTGKKLLELKMNVTEQMKSSLSECKSKGKGAVIKAIDLSHMKAGISRISNCLEHTKAMLNTLVDKIDQVSMETRKAKVSVVNIGKVLLGKPVLKYEEDKNRLNKLQKMCRSIYGSTDRLLLGTINLTEILESINKSSVKQEIQQVSHHNKDTRKRVVRNKER